MSVGETSYLPELVENVVALVREKWSGSKAHRYSETAYGVMKEMADLLESLSARVTQAETTEWGYLSNESGKVIHTFTNRRPYDAEGLTVMTRKCLPWEVDSSSRDDNTEASNG